MGDAIHIFIDFLVRNILDFAKVLDIVSIPTLKNKLNKMGIRGNELKLFVRSYTASEDR